MSTSQNGYPANDRACIHTVIVPGTSVQLPVRKGPAGDLLLWAATRWHREVEPLTPGWNWGYAERLIRGSSTEVSNHASGTAIDLNAPKHPRGTSPTANFSGAQINTIRRVIRDAGGALRWGGDYTAPSLKDGMHLEVIASEAACALALARVTGSPTTPETDPDMAVMPWTLPAGQNMEQTIPVPLFAPWTRGKGTLWMVTGWEAAQVHAMYFVRDKGPGKTPQQEGWGGTGKWTLAPDDRPSFDLGPDCTSIAVMYDSPRDIQCLIVYPAV